MPIAVAGFMGIAGPVTQPGRRIVPNRWFRSAPFSSVNETITGVTKDSTGVALGTCVVKLFRTLTDTLVDTTTSDASGNYSFYNPGSGPFYLVAYKDTTTDVAGTTINTIVADGFTFTSRITFVDNFTRADSDPMSTTASDGHIWIDAVGGMESCKILSNNLRGTAAGSSNGWAAMCSTPTFPANQGATVTIGIVPSANFLGVGLRIQSAVDCSGYWILTDGAANSIQVYLYQSNGVSQTTVGAAISITALVIGDVITAEISGTTITIKVNGVQVAQRTDTTFSSGQPAVFCELACGISAFSATDL